MKKTVWGILTILVTCGTGHVSAQSIAPSILNSGGGSAPVGGYIIEYNAGEMMAVSTAITSDLVVTQGLLQPAPAPINLPVTLVRFQGVKKNQYNELSWITAYESGNTVFELQRSDDGRNFAAIYSVPASGISNGSHYSYPDYRPFIQKVFYRLRMTEAGLPDKYSQVIVLYDQQVSNWTVFPNPVMRNSTLQVSIQHTGIATSAAIILLDAAGRTVFERNEMILPGSQTISISLPLSAGTYTLRLAGFGGNESKKIIIQ